MKDMPGDASHIIEVSDKKIVFYDDKKEQFNVYERSYTTRTFEPQWMRILSDKLREEGSKKK